MKNRGGKQERKPFKPKWQGISLRREGHQYYLSTYCYPRASHGTMRNQCYVTRVQRKKGRERETKEKMKKAAGVGHAFIHSPPGGCQISIVRAVFVCAPRPQKESCHTHASQYILHVVQPRTLVVEQAGRGPSHQLHPVQSISG